MVETLKFLQYKREELRPVRFSQTKKLSFIVNETHAIEVIGRHCSANQMLPKLPHCQSPANTKSPAL